MKTPSLGLVASVTFGLCLATPALRSAAERPAKEREHNQQERIANGVESGELTPEEVARLEAREKELRKQLASGHSPNGGTMTQGEREQFKREINNISGRIYRQKHDAQKAGNRPAAEVGKREKLQQERIGNGVESGELTPAETQRLEAREAALRKQIADDRSANGGKLTPEEREQVNKELNELSARIYRQKHDGQTAK